MTSGTILAFHKLSLKTLDDEGETFLAEIHADHQGIYLDCKSACKTDHLIRGNSVEI